MTSASPAVAATRASDGVEWEVYPIYAPAGGAGAPRPHVVRFLSTLPTVPRRPTDPPSHPPQLQYPFSSSTRLTSPRVQSMRPAIVSRKRSMKPAAGAKQQQQKEDEEGVDPNDKKWRLEDAKQGKSSRFVYLGSKDLPPRKEIHALATSQQELLLRTDGQFLLLPFDSYSFRHEEAAAERLTLEEAEQKMRTRMKRFEKRMRSMATLAAQADEEDGGASAAAAGGGGGMALERARPTGTSKAPAATSSDSRADDAFADAFGASSRSVSRAAALARKAKAKQEEGADYVRHFDDDDVDANDDRLDGQGGEASDLENDEEDTLHAERIAAEEDAAAIEKKKAAALSVGRDHRSIDEAEEEAELAEIEAEMLPADEEGGDEATGPSAAGGSSRRGASSARRGEESDESVDESDLSLSDESSEEEEEEEKKEARVKMEGITPSRKRPSSPATAAAAAKKVKLEGGSAASAAAASSAAAPAAAAAAVPPIDLAEMERLVVSELQSAPSGSPYTSKTLAQHLNKKFPAQFNRRSAEALRNILRKVVAILPDKVHIVLKAGYQKQT